jgi:hypothetical protein
MFRSDFEPTRSGTRPLTRSIAILLASAWCVSATPTFAGRPVDPKELPLPVAESSRLIAAANPTASELPAIAQAETAANAAASATADAALTSAPPPVRPSVSESVTVNLINRLVERGVLTKDDSADLIKLAEQDAAEAKVRAAAQQDAAIQAAVAQAVATLQQQPPQFSPAPDLMPPEQDAMRVTYIPEPVKAQLREDIKQEVLAQAKQENWASPRTVPEWVTRIKLFGDIRVRYETVLFPDDNDATGSFPNFNAINTGSPYDISGFQFAPQLNVDEDRQRFRLRARFGAEAELGDGFTAGIRLATGENNSPTSTNQSMGLANQGQGGNFSKYAIWLDRAFLRYEVGGEPNKNLAVSVGRFDNPFFSSELIWDDDLGFDGAALQVKYPVTRKITTFANLGAFVVFNTDFNFSSIQPDKFPSDDKYLYAAQFGVDWKVAKDWQLKLAGAYYRFDNIEGQLSDPFTPLTAQDAGNTDNTRPSFAQKGNTYFPLRNIVPNALNNFGTTNQFQYFGLASPYEEFALTARLDYNGWEPFQVSLSGEWVKNIAFDQNDIASKAVNNRGPDRANGLLGKYEGGDTAWLINLRVGHPVLQKFGDWAVGLNYRYVESDAVVDGFNDSDFGGGGTNIKGYSLFGQFALSQRIWLGLRWMSANEVSGPQYKQDTLQIDLNGKF